MKFIKIMRKQCLGKGCKNKATHFGINGKINYGLCDDCYEIYCGAVKKLKTYSEFLYNLMEVNNENEQPAEHSQSESHRAEEQKASACGQSEP